MFTFSGRISARREISDAVAGNQAMALAIAEEADVVDETLAAGRKLTEKVNKTQTSYEQLNRRF